MANNHDFQHVGGPIDRTIKRMRQMKGARIIKKAEMKPEAEAPTKTMMIGGNCGDENHLPPTIILEKDGDVISRIIVKCPCGNFAELEITEEEEA